MEIEEAIQLKKELEKEIYESMTKSLNNFNYRTGLDIDSINIDCNYIDSIYGRQKIIINKIDIDIKL